MTLTRELIITRGPIHKPKVLEQDVMRHVVEALIGASRSFKNLTALIGCLHPFPLLPQKPGVVLNMRGSTNKHTKI